jgi:hypothetical protein
MTKLLDENGYPTLELRRRCLARLEELGDQLAYEDGDTRIMTDEDEIRALNRAIAKERLTNG